MKLNPGKYHLLVSGFKFENVWTQIGNITLTLREKCPNTELFLVGNSPYSG